MHFLDSVFNQHLQFCIMSNDQQDLLVWKLVTYFRTNILHTYVNINKYILSDKKMAIDS